jgi:hypothetical protein
MLPHHHLRALTNELTNLVLPANATPKGKLLLQLLQTWIQALLNPPPIFLEQRVDNDAIAREEEQRVISIRPQYWQYHISQKLRQSCNPAIPWQNKR